MIMEPLVLAVLAGALVGTGAWVLGLVLHPVRMPLIDALALLGPGHQESVGTPVSLLGEDSDSRWERLGALLYRRCHIPVLATTQRLLAVSGRSIGDFLVEKTILLLAGLVVPSLVGWVVYPWFGSVGIVPLGVGVVCGIAGWWWPDLAIRRRANDANADSRATLTTFVDLVVLARLANLSLPQALESASEVSDAPLFVHIKKSLERARLSHQPPHAGLAALARELGMPELADLADLLSLDEQGAPLADLLMSQVSDLRDAHLNQEKAAAHKTSEEMTIWMSIPVVLFSLAFLVPPLLTLIGQ